MIIIIVVVVVVVVIVIVIGNGPTILKHMMVYVVNGSYSSVVRGYAPGGGGPGFNPHHIKLSGLEVRPFKVSGGIPVHLRSKHRATGSGN